jgi:chromatin modification-related protein VID21
MRQEKIASFVLFLRRGADIAVHRTSLSTRKRKLRELYRVTTACTATLNAGYQPKLEDAIYSDPDEKEGRFLDENDQAK